MTERSWSRRLPAYAAAVLLLGPFAPVLSASGVGAQANVVPGASGYSPCEPGQQDIDLLVMMDASGSLNAPSGGLDPNGELRRTALRRFRGDLTSVLAKLPESDSGNVRVALWRFESDVEMIAPFRAPSASHPSDAQIDLSLGEQSGGGLSYRTNHTDYLRALGAVEQAFDTQGAPGACRLLLFFTDGVYDPLGKPSLEQADELREAVCGGLKWSFENAGIDTYSILLGDAFRHVAGDTASSGATAVEDEMLTASKQIMRALTGHDDSPLVRGLPYSDLFDCERWSDEQPADRAGSIIAIGDLGQLAVQLLEVAEVAARGLVEWNDCGVAQGSGRRSGPLPAGDYIDTIVAYPRDELVEAYKIVTADGETITRLGTGNRPLYLDSEVLDGLAPGWTLEFITDGVGGGIDVSCYAKQATGEIVGGVGEITDADGDPLDDVVRSTAGADSPPLSGVRITADAPLGLCELGPDVWPDERVSDWYCRDGSVVFELHPLQCQEHYELDKPLAYEFEPEFAEDLFGPGRVVQHVRIDVDGSARRLYDCLGAPLLTCGSTAAVAGDSEDARLAEVRAGPQHRAASVLIVEPDSHELPRSPLIGSTECRLFSPQDGEANVRATWRPDGVAGDLPGDLDWRFDGDFYGDEFGGIIDDGGMVLRLSPNGDPDGVVLRFVTTDELVNADWDIAGVIELVPSWDPGIGDPEIVAAAEAQMTAQRTTVRADRQYAARSNSAMAFWLTLLALIATFLVSYVFFCLALWSNASLPDPNRFWLYHTVLPVDRGAGSRLGFGRDAPATLATAGPESIRAKAAGRRRSRYSQWRGQRPQIGGDGIAVDLRRSPRFWLPGLLRSPWSEVSVDGWTVAASPKGRHPARRTAAASASAEFSALDVVGSPRHDVNGELVAPVWFARLRPRGTESPDPPDTRQLGLLLNEATVADEASGQAQKPTGAAGGLHRQVRAASADAGRNPEADRAGERGADDEPQPPRHSDRPPPRRRNGGSLL